MGRRRTWTDDDLRVHVPQARSWRDLRDRLGLTGGGSTSRRLRERCAELGLDVEHLPAPGESPRRWTDEQLRRAVATSSCLKGVFDELGLAVGGSAWRRMQDHILRLRLDTSHWRPDGVQPGGGPARRPIVIDEAHLREVLPVARSMAHVLRALGLDPGNGSHHRRLKERIRRLDLDTDHLGGQAWARGRAGGRPAQPLDEVLVRDSPYRGGSSSLRDRLVAEAVLAWACAMCGITTWRGRRAPLQLDHVNGDNRDNRPQNLRLLCPNCHALTPTYCGRNIGNGYSSGSGSG